MAFGARFNFASAGVEARPETSATRKAELRHRLQREQEVGKSPVGLSEHRQRRLRRSSRRRSQLGKVRLQNLLRCCLNTCNMCRTPMPTLDRGRHNILEKPASMVARRYRRKSCSSGCRSAAARGAAAMGTSSKSMTTAKGYGGSSSRPMSLASAWRDEPPPWVETPKHMAMPRPPVEPGEDPHRGYENPWERPHWPQAPRLIPPYGGEEDTLTLQPSVWWNQILFDKVQFVVDEEATKFRPIPRTDAWDYTYGFHQPHG